MVQVTVEEASSQLSRLLEEAENGEEVVITDGDARRARPLSLPSKPRPRLGTAEGKVWIADDFDAPLEEFKDYM